MVKRQLDNQTHSVSNNSNSNNNSIDNSDSYSNSNRNNDAAIDSVHKSNHSTSNDSNTVSKGKQAKKKRPKSNQKNDNSNSNQRNKKRNTKTKEIRKVDERMEFYRSTSVGIALTNSLNEMLERNAISEEKAIEVMDNYDKVFPSMLQKSLIIDKASVSNSAVGEIYNYNSVMNLWKIDIQNLDLLIDGMNIHYDRARVLFNTK